MKAANVPVYDTTSDPLSLAATCGACGKAGYEASTPDGDVIRPGGSEYIGVLPDDAVILCASARAHASLVCDDCAEAGR